MLTSSFLSQIHQVTNLFSDSPRSATGSLFENININVDSLVVMKTGEELYNAGKRSSNGNEIRLAPFQFMLINLVGTWSDPFTGDERVAVAILVPNESSEHIDN